jgi:hypothetical protein
MDAEHRRGTHQSIFIKRRREKYVLNPERNDPSTSDLTRPSEQMFISTAMLLLRLRPLMKPVRCGRAKVPALVSTA